MTRRSQLIALASLGSLALLLAAFGFQHLGGLAPCKMCIWQRYPHGVAIAIGVLALALPRLNILPLCGAMAAAVTSGIGFYHAGVEQGWWEGPTSCTSGSISGMSNNDLFDQIMSAPLVRCDDIPWEMFNISMAGWNAIASAVLVLIWLAAWRSGRA